MVYLVVLRPFFVDDFLSDEHERYQSVAGFHYITPPKTNMKPENGPLEKEIPIGNHHFQVPCSFFGVY